MDDSSPPTVSQTSGWLSISHVTPFNNAARSPSSSTTTPASPTLEDSKAALKACLEHLFEIVKRHHHPSYVLASVTLMIASELMPLFAELNTVYATFFDGSYPPPVRTCISVPLPRGQLCEVQAVATAAPPESSSSFSASWRRALHVQGLSYWAPACIGPYSQAVRDAIDGLTFLSGQIAMRPSNLDLVTQDHDDGASGSGLRTELALSAQHVRRVVGAACDDDGQGWMEGGVCWVERGRWRSCLSEVARAWAHWHSGAGAPPLVICTAEALPKKASVEWQLCWRALPRRDEEDDDDDNEEDQRQDDDKADEDGSRSARPRRIEGESEESKLFFEVC
jgi:diphthine-ammonia ligase